MVKRLIYYMSLLATVLLSACTDNDATIADEPLPDGMGRIRIAISSPEIVGGGTTRGVNTVPWEDPDHEWEKLQNFRIYICTESNQVVDIIEGTKADMTGEAGTASTYNKRSKELKSSPLTAGKYHIFATANFNSSEATPNSANEDDVYDDGISVGSIIDPANNTFKFANGYSNKNIPMTGKQTDTDGTLKTVTVYNAKETDAGIISVWRVLAKMQFEFTNESAESIEILGIEVDPINQASSSGPGIYLFSKDNLTSTANLAPLDESTTTVSKGVTATWALNDNETITTPLNGIISETSLLTSAQLALGSKVTATGSVTAEDEAKTKLQKFKTTENIENKDEASVITLTVTPKSGLSFKPTDLSFTASRVGTDGGKIAVVAGSTTLAENQQPARYNGKGGLHEPPFITKYNYKLTSAATTAPFVIKIYLYGLKQKEIAFSDIVITGTVMDVEQTMSGTKEYLTLPPAPSGADKKSGREDVGPVTYTPASAVTLSANGGKGTLFFYVNETDASFTTTQNQLSLRFKIKRGSIIEEIRYGVTTHYGDGTTGHDGFNVIRRNDWIHIPVVLTDWQFRVEPLAFVPIAGYPAATVSSDGLTTTFSTGGMIALQPFVKKYDENTWRAFGDPEINDISISWRSLSGSESLVTTPFIYDPVTKCIIGELNNNLAAGTYMTTITVNATLGSYPYSFTFNVVLQK